MKRPRVFWHRLFLGVWLWMLAWSMNRYFEGADAVGLDAPGLHLLAAALYAYLAVQEIRELTEAS